MSLPDAITQEKETMLLTLYARAIDSRMPDPILDDPWAVEAVGKVDYDFSRLEIGRSRALLIAARARQFDLWTAEFLARHASASVLHLGCGLDARMLRVGHSSAVRWYDVDYPEVIALRRQLFDESETYRMIGSSLSELSWMSELVADAPWIVVAEGVTMYLTEGSIRSLLRALVDQLGCGRIAFDVHSHSLVEFSTKNRSDVGGTGASFRWGIDDPGEVTALEPRLELIADVRAPLLPGHSRMPLSTRVFVRLTDAVPALRRMRCLLFGFGTERLGPGAQHADRADGQR